METGLRFVRRRSLSSRRLLQLAILMLAIFLQEIAAQKVDVEPTQATLTEGKSVNLLCRSGNPVGYCRFEIPGESRVVVLSEEWPSKVPGYKYYGQGTKAGQCGATIERVNAQNHGTVKCYIGYQGVETIGNIDLIVALPPQRPELEFGQGSVRNFYEADEVLNVRCSSRDGRPAANISWFLDEEPIVEGLSTPEIIETRRADNTTLFTSRQQLERRLIPTDDRKFLTCRSSHIADRGQDNTVRHQLVVRYRPMPQQDITVYGVTLTRTALINVTIQANPPPRIEWMADGIAIPQGQQNGRYEAFEPKDLGNGLYDVKLSIDSLTLEDTTKSYILRASNELGQTEYTVRISSSNTPASSGLDIGAIIGIVVAVAILLIIVILIIFARATGRWCFGAKTSQPPISETPENEPINTGFLIGSDTESADLKSTKFKNLTLPKFTLPVFMKRNTKHQSDDETNQNGGQNEDEQQLASVTVDTNTSSENPETREDKQLVYAELVLKPADDKPVPAQKDSTEYAEIVHIQKPSSTNEQ